MKKLLITWLSSLVVVMYLFVNTAYSVEADSGSMFPENGDCHATYFAKNGKLFVPCVDLIDSVDDVQSYAIVMEQQATADLMQFAVKEWSPIDNNSIVGTESSCRAIYFREAGKLWLPCVDVIDSSRQVIGFHEVTMEQIESAMVELYNWVVMEIDGENLLGQSQSKAKDLRSSLGLRAAPKKECDFSNESGKGKCFEAVGNQCSGGIPSTLGYDKQNPKYDYNTCKVQAYVTTGSQAHDSCCAKNPKGRACQGWSKAEDSADRKKAACSKEWDKAFSDSMLWKGRWVWFGPYYKATTTKR